MLFFRMLMRILDFFQTKAFYVAGLLLIGIQIRPPMWDREFGIQSNGDFALVYKIENDNTILVDIANDSVVSLYNDLRSGKSSSVYQFLQIGSGKQFEVKYIRMQCDWNKDRFDSCNRIGVKEIPFEAKEWYKYLQISYLMPGLMGVLFVVYAFQRSHQYKLSEKKKSIMLRSILLVPQVILLFFFGWMMPKILNGLMDFLQMFFDKVLKFNIIGLFYDCLQGISEREPLE